MDPDTASKAREKACVEIVEATQLLSSVSVDERCRDKGAHEDVVSNINLTIARFVVRLAMSLASKKTGGFGEDVVSMTVAFGEAECCVLRLPEGQARQTSRTKHGQRAGANGSHRTVMSVQQVTTTNQSRGK